MAKVTSQSIPPELAVLWAALTSPGKLTQGDAGTIKIKRNKKKPDKEPPIDKDLAALRAMAEIIATLHPDAWASMGRSTFILNLLKSMILGNFSADYFDEVPPETVVVLQSAPTSIADPNPPPYGYRTPVFLPSIPTYPNGVPVAYPLGYFGEKSAGLFVDRYLNWAKITFKPQALNEPDALALMLMFWSTNITITTSSRGSRPMLSLAAVAMLCKPGAATITSTTPPIEKVSSLYWRFRMPAGGPPYYNATTGRRIVKPLKTLAKIQGTGDDVSLIINAANRPMLGRGFNNNDYVQTGFTDIPKVYEIRTCTAAKNAYWKNLAYAGNLHPRCIAYRDDLGIYVAMGTTNALRSTDLVSWSEHFVWSNLAWMDITFCKGLGKFLAVGYVNNVGRVASCTVGYDWSILTNIDLTEYTAVGWSKELGIAVICGFGATDSVMKWTDDGVTLHNGATSWLQTCYAVKWIKEINRFVAVGEYWSGQMGQTSIDGKNWSPMTINLPTGLIDFAYSPKLKYMVGVDNYSGTHRVAFSNDGQTWSAQSNGLTFAFSSIEWSPPLNGFIASAGASGHSSLYFSATGHSWAPINAADTTGWGRVRFFEKPCLNIACNPNTTGPRFQRTDRTP